MPRALVAAGLVALLLGSGGGTMGADLPEVVRRGPATNRAVALTIDDGWHPGRCEEMFETLVELGVPATWFPNAVYVDRTPALWRRIARRHPIANHTTHHRSLPTLPDSRVRQEITSSERRIERVTGRSVSKVLRPPYGAFDRRVLRLAGELGYETVALWDISAADTSRGATLGSVVRNASRGKAGSIVLMHCGPEVTPRALPFIIARYACQGLRFSTLEGLLSGDRGVQPSVSCPPPRVPRDRASRSDGPATPRQAPDRSELEGREWRLAAALSASGLEPVAPEVQVTVRFASRTASGFAGCDPYSAPIRRGRDGRISFGRVMRGREGCVDAEVADSGDYLELLAASVDYSVADGMLDLLDADGREHLRFQAVEPLSLVGEWRVASLLDETGGGVEPAPERPLTVSFGPTGQLRGSTGCNSYVGGYSMRGESLMVGPLLIGPAACTTEVQELETRFLEALRSTAGWRIQDGRLELRDAGGGTLLELTAPEPPS